MTPDLVPVGRDAFARQDWRAAHDALARSRTELTTADLELLAEAAWWMGDSPRSMAVSEEAYQRLVAEGRSSRPPTGRCAWRWRGSRAGTSRSAPPGWPAHA